MVSSFLLLGYGHIAPKTVPGQLVAILYSLLGIPLTVLAVRRLSNKIIDKVMIIVQFTFACVDNRIASGTENAEGESTSEEDGGKNPAKQRRKSQGTDKGKRNRRKKIASVVILFMMVFLFITLSSTLRMLLEGWTMEQSVYFWFTTLTTVGFGDFVPFEGRQPPNLVLTVFYYIGTFYLMFGLALIASFIQSIAELFEVVLPPADSQRNRGNSVRQAHHFDLEEGTETRATPKQPDTSNEQLYAEGEAQSLYATTVSRAIAWSSTGALEFCLSDVSNRHKF